jgi:hypothetical protein
MLTSSIGSLTIFSGSTTQANVYLIGGGGAAGNTNRFAANGLGGGGAGGVVRYNNFPLVPATYGIIAGGGGNIGTLGSPPDLFNPGTAPYVAAGLLGTTSSITLPNNLTYSPFTSSNIVAFGGNGGGAATGDGTYVSYVKVVNSTPGGSNGGGAQTNSGTNANTPATTAGFGLGGLNGLNQGNLGGGVGAFGAPFTSRLKGCSVGGGGAMSASLDITPIGTSPWYSAPVTNGGDGILLKIYPIDNGTASYYAGGGNASNITVNITSSAGLGADTIGGGGSSEFTALSLQAHEGKAGGVYIEYPYIPYTPQPILATNGLTLYNAINSFSSSIWYDVSGNGNNALVSGTIYQDTNTNGYLFNGFTNYLTYSSSLVATPSSSMTLQWYGTYYPSGSNRFLFTKNDYLDGWDTIFTTTNNITFRDEGDSNLGTNYTYPERTLYTLLVTNQSSTLYKNAEIAPAISSDSGKPFTGFNSSSQSLRFGYPVDGDATYFKGAISSLLIYNRLLYPQEIANNYAYLSASAYGYVNPIPTPVSTSVDYLIVGGAGGGGTITSSNSINAGGGGGGGQFISSSFTSSAFVAYPVIVGSGGGGSTNGQSSSIFGQTAIGGGGGGSWTSDGLDGACGGGAGAQFGGGNNGGTGSNGFNGGDSAGENTANLLAWAGGGGGVGSAGETGPVGGNYLIAADGGSGNQWLNGLFYAAGGGAGYASSVGPNQNLIQSGSGGSGIGGNGAVALGGGIYSKQATVATANRGAGGGGGGRRSGTNYNPTSGSAGVAIVRYFGSGSKAIGGTISYSGSYTYHTFNSSSTLTFID